jgi:hypothetical protein
MRLFMAIISLAVYVLVSSSSFAAPPDGDSHLFYIERSKNRNLVQYDFKFEDNGLPNSKPVTAYWVLENGRKENLTQLERKFAYGIDSQQRLSKDRFRVHLISFKDREIFIEKIDGLFRAIVSISGKESVLEKIYVNTKERLARLPKVLYVELFGRTKESGLPVKERIVPNS